MRLSLGQNWYCESSSRAIPSARVANACSAVPEGLIENEVFKKFTICFGKNCQVGSDQMAASIVVARMIHGCLRFALNFQKLNGFMKREVYLLSHTRECIECLCEAAVFCRKDMKGGY